MLYDKLYDWQKNIVEKFKIKKSFGLFLDMGLGKTPISLAFAEQHRCTKILVVTLNSKVIESEKISGSWKYWTNKMEYKYVFKSKSDLEFDNTSNEMMIVNYESLFERTKNKKSKVTLKKSIENFIKSCKGHNVAFIIDESHKLKSLQSLQTLAAQKIKSELDRLSVCYMYLLTGTPFTTGYIDLYSQLKFLGLTMNKGQYVDNFCIRGNLPGLLGYQQPIVGYKNINTLFNLVHQFAITSKSDAFVKLPEQISIKLPVKMSNVFEAYTNEYLSIEKIKQIIKLNKIEINDELKNKLNCKDKKISNPFYRNVDYPSLDYLAETSGAFWLRARQLSIGFQGNAEKSIWYDRRRLDKLKTFLEDNPDNYLLFYNYTPELLEIYDICEQLGYNIDVYCGEAKSTVFYDKYVEQTNDEQMNNRKNILIANFASGGTGKNWQAYNKCIIFSCPLYKDYEQALKRIHRLGQTKTTYYYYFYQQNWLDYSMFRSLREKTNYSSDMFESDLKRIQSLQEVDDM